MRARVLVLPAAALLIVGLLLRHSLAVTEPVSPATVAHSDSPQMLHPGQVSAPTPRPELPPDDVAGDDSDLPPECPEGCPTDNPEGDYLPNEREPSERLPAVAPNTIHGHLTDTRGMPVSGAVVTALLTGVGVSRAYTTISGDSGYYALPDLRQGTYAVTYAFEGQTQEYELEIDGKTEVVAEPVLALTETIEHDPDEEIEESEPQTGDRAYYKRPNIDYEYEL